LISTIQCGENSIFLTGGADRIEKADELLMGVALRAATNDLTFQQVECGEQRLGAMPLVVLGERSTTPPGRTDE
jgi:hypothetical protein